MKMKYKIEKDKILNTYVVWEVHRNYEVQVFMGYKYMCKDFIKRSDNND